MPDTQTLPQVVQLGVESTAGVSPGGGATKLLTGLNIMLDPDFTTVQYAASGHRFDTISVPSMEKSKLKGDGPLTYTEVVYPESGVFGASTITTPVGAVAARQWASAPTLTGIITPQTYQVQKGDSVQARQVNYGTFTDFGFAASRKETKVSVAGFAQQIQDGIALTASPTAVPLVPVEPGDWNVYLDTVAANIGTTKLLRCFAANFGYTGAYGDAWPMDRAQASFATIANIKPSLAVSLMLAADSTLASLWTKARQAGKVYIRFEAISALLVDNLQTVTITGAPTGGTFTLTYKGQTTAPITFNSTTHHPTAAEVQTALVALSTIGTGNVSCTGGPIDGTPVVIAMTGTLAQDTTAITASGAGLTGGTPTIGVVQSNVPYSYVRDVCAVPAPDAYQDTQGIWTQLWSFFVTEDPLWLAGNASGTAVMRKVVNGLTAL